jgi:CelD/BcsL family acetyltransferase involved in cellulose biosynthesis
MPETGTSPGNAPSSARFRVEPVTTVDHWREIAAAWDRVLRATEGYTGLQSFDFLSTWWACLAADRKLWILAFYDGDELVGVAPLQLAERRILGKAYRVLQFLAMTEDILRPTMLFPAQHRQALLAALNGFLAEHRRSWDMLELDELARAERLTDSMRKLAGVCGCLYRQTPFHACPYLELGSLTPESFWRGRSSKLRKNLRAGERKLAQMGPVDLEIYRTPDDIHVGFEKFRGIARLSWKHEARIGMADDARYEIFYDRLLGTFARRHAARALILTVAGRPVAATLALLFDGVYYSLQIVHDEAYARYSPGTLLEARELELLLRERDARRYEFMGGALSNKLRWTGDVVESVCVRLARPDPRMRAMELYERVKPVAKRAFKRARAAAALRRGAGA